MTGQSQGHEGAEKQAALRRKVDGAGPETRTPEHPLLTLQSQIGNAQVARLLQRAAAEEEEPVQAKHDLSVQREAEEEELAAKHDTSLQREAEEEELAAKHDTSLQREAEEEELAAKHDLAQRANPEEEEPVQAQHDLAQREEDQERVGIEGGPVGPDTAQRIESARGGGSSLDASTRGTMEAGFGTSFEDVRVHHDSQSDVLARRLTSHAFTTGSDIFLRGDASPSDNHLIAHELTHVVQQRSMSGGGGMSVGAAGDTHEHEADATADAVLSHSASPVAAGAGSAQRAAAEEEENLQANHDLSQRQAEDDETPS